jgi:hypothetical protein
LSSLLIAAGLVLFSVLVMNRVKGGGLFGRTSRFITGCTSGVLLALGLLLHFSTAPGTLTGVQNRETTAPHCTQPAREFTFSFEPKAVRWGEKVRLQVTPEIEKVDVYLNGTPLPCRTIGRSLFVVTVPTIARSGYFTLDCGSTKVRAAEELVVLSR